MNEDYKKLYEKVMSDEFMNSLSKNKLAALIRAASRTRKKRFSRRKKPKYIIPGFKAMPLGDIDLFFSAFKPEEYRFKVLFLIQAFLGLRIGEVVRLNLKDLDFRNKQVAIHTEKKHYDQTDFLYMHEKLEQLLLEYISIYEKEIKEHDGYLFFTTNKRCRFPYISPDRARNIFRKVCERAGLTQTYSEREGKKKGKLYRYTTHSLRHSFGHFLAEREIPIEIAKHLLRHDSIQSTQIYYLPSKEKIDATMRNLFALNPVSRPK
jgi:integrase